MNADCCKLLKPGTLVCDDTDTLAGAWIVEVAPLVVLVTVLVIAILGLLARGGVVTQSLNVWAATPNCPCPYTWAAVSGTGILIFATLIYKYRPVESHKTELN
ncbi:MAG: hypothetical protein KR126chlam2_01264 [Chlamydiae bacterium]|nr:hypothetical protein [Chlamydiota bacterium]